MRCRPTPLQAVRRPVVLAVVIAAAVAPAACSDEEADEATGTTDAASTAGTVDGQPPSEEVTTEAPSVAVGCNTLSQVAYLQGGIDGTLSGTADWAEVQQDARSLKSQVGEFYERAVDDLPQLVAPLETVAAFTDEKLAVAIDSASVEEYAGAVAALPDAQAAMDATMAIDLWTQDNCGFDFAAAH